MSGTHGADVVIGSNAAVNSTFKIQFRGTACARENKGDVCGGCGDGVVGQGEMCDDGNVVETDACRNDCTVARCGDGIVQMGVEACDDGNTDETDACRTDCTEARCGDGVVWVDVEVCDDGNDDNGDACTNSCTSATCGDGIVHVGVEACDDGNQNENDACLPTCIANVCGDGVLNPDTEMCDDGNAVTEDCAYGEVQCTVCAADCTEANGQTHRCGDGVLDAGEDCDDGNTVTETCEYGVDQCTVCAADCTEQPGVVRRCGDGNTDAEEQCDDGNTVTEVCEYGVEACTVCAANCREENGAIRVCGDDVRDLENEGCDDGNTVTETCEYGVDQCTVCAADCTEQPGVVRRCGDGNTDAEEQCDDGNTVTEVCEYGVEACTVCAANCREENGAIRVCGDDVRDLENEGCDDGNTVTETCEYGVDQCTVCAADCTEQPGVVRRCGDGITDAEEQCDDGNDVDTDHCTNNCQSARCGDGIVGPGERCDGGEACSVHCTLVADCGNGLVEEGERCDDGNLVDGDGCSARCLPDAHCEMNDGQLQYDFVTLQPGQFRMGSPQFAVATPVHDVRVEAFQLMRTEISVAQYRCCVNAGVCTPPDCEVETISDGWQACNYAHGREQHPVNFVTWHDAVAFAQWAGHRLPSEAEWEYAARAGGKSQNHPWGDQPPTCERADHRFNSRGQCGDLGTSPGCSHPLGNTEQGICDLAGNVYEWMADEWHASFNGAPDTAVPWGGLDNPNAERIIRGCNWSGDEDHLHVAWRRRWDPSLAFSSNGFRLARDIAPGCGNSVLEDGEECDGGADCAADCTFAPICGNGRLEIGEACDDGVGNTTACPYGQEQCSVCAADCTLQAGQTSVCGDLIVDEGNGEQCDDGNGIDQDGCSNACQLNALCGNDQLDAGEDCDGDANTTSFCGADCQCDIQLGIAEHGQACARSTDCATGLCIPNPHEGGAGQCTMLCDGHAQCPDLERCLLVATTPDVCLSAAQGVPTNGFASVCVPNETGYPCDDGRDCPFESLYRTA